MGFLLGEFKKGLKVTFGFRKSFLELFGRLPLRYHVWTGRNRLYPRNAANLIFGHANLKFGVTGRLAAK